MAKPKARPKLVMVGFKADPATVKAIDKIVDKLETAVFSSKKSLAIRLGLQFAAEHMPVRR